MGLANLLIWSEFWSYFGPTNCGSWRASDITVNCDIRALFHCLMVRLNQRCWTLIWKQSNTTASAESVFATTDLIHSQKDSELYWGYVQVYAIHLLLCQLILTSVIINMSKSIKILHLLSLHGVFKLKMHQNPFLWILPGLCPWCPSLAELMTPDAPTDSIVGWRGEQ